MLFTREHFAAALTRLRLGGLFVQWLPLYQLQPHDLKTIIRTFLEVFPDTHSMIGNFGGEAAFGLFGWSPSPNGNQGSIDLLRVERLLKLGLLPHESIQGVDDFLAACMLDGEALRQYAGEGAINTDLNLRILFDAPRGLGGDSHARSIRSLASLLPYRMPFPTRLAASGDAQHVDELMQSSAARAEAATHYLGAEVSARLDEKNNPSITTIDAYLSAYQASPKFAPATLALMEIAGRNTSIALDIVGRMAKINPGDHRLKATERELGKLTEPAPIRDVLLRFLQTP